ncbi:ABC transporter permease subunit [Pseudokineococcus sp. 1T1Z-3]|uniref:ABC transporter permease subunit n=1 Tax=Pseudokineococcus sp. 1T1Z-3 TaxID=3132745 RepID=UPI0030AEDE28
MSGTAPALGTAPVGAVARPVLRERRRAVALWSVAVATVAAVYIAFWPSLGEDDALADYVEAMPAGVVEAMGLDAVATAGGYLSATVYGVLAPALLLVLAIGSGAQLLAGGEEDGTLELELAGPVSRRRTYLERAAALWAVVTVVVAALTATVLLAASAAAMDVDAGHVLAGGAGLLLLAGALGTVALAVGAATGRRAAALAAAAGLAVVSFVADALGSLVEGASWLTQLSPWSWYLGGEPLLTGWDPAGLAALAGLAVVAGALGLLAVERRDLLV